MRGYIISMNSKERVLTALKHEQPDRTPCNYIGTPEISDVLKKHFSTEDMDVVLKNLGVDLRVIKLPYVGPELRKWQDGRFQNYWGHIRKSVKNQAGQYDEAAEYPYANFKTIHDVDTFRWPQLDWFDISKVVEDCDRYSDYAVVYGAPSNMDMINGTRYGMGFQTFMENMALRDEITVACMEKRFKFCYALSERVLKEADGRIDILWIGDDYGAQDRMQISPTMFRELFMPKLRQMCELGHSYGAKVMLHSCGSTREIWPDLIKAGVDIYETVQPEAKGMDPAELKKEFGDRICFHGTISTQNTLPFGTPQDVALEVRLRIDTVGKNGGLILASSHNIQPDTSLQNILTLYQTVKEYKN